MEKSGNARRSGKRFTRLPAGAALAALLLLAGVSARAADYRLDSMDKLNIRVAEWQTAQGAVRDWNSINGEYTVGPSGNVSLPFVGELPVKGKTTADVAAQISEELQQKFGLLDRPDASVEVAEFRPFFVAGDVQTPGKYPCGPSLTVLKAVSLAGGVRRSNDLGQRFERDFIDARGNYQVLLAQRNSLMATLARLIAEAEGKADIDFPKEVQNAADGQRLMANETAFKQAREKKLRVQLKQLADLKSLLQNEVTTLAQKMETQQRQIDLSRKDLANVNNLAQRGLAVNQRILNLEENTAELEGKLLDMETASLQAKQDISKADQDAANLQNDRDAEIAQDRQQTEADLQAVNLKLSMYKDLMTEAVVNDPQGTAGSAGAASLAVSYSIVRENDGKTNEIQADENTQVLPGDIVKVSIATTPLNSN